MLHTNPPRLSILVGKGGVGRTTVAAGMGLVSSRRGVRTILVELVPIPVIPPCFGTVDRGYDEVALAPNLSLVRVTWEDALREYGLMKLRLRNLVRLVFDNPFMRHLLPAIPGLAEILVMGKVIHMAMAKGSDGQPTHVVLDGPATGHALSLLMAPAVVARSFASGPLADDAIRLRDFLADPTCTRVAVVATPEEMPVTEALELREKLVNEAGIPVETAFLNGMIPWGLDESSQAAIRRLALTHREDVGLATAACAALFLSERSDVGRRHFERMQRGGISRVIPLPAVPAGGDPRMRLMVLADHLDAVLWREGR